MQTLLKSHTTSGGNRTLAFAPIYLPYVTTGSSFWRRRKPQFERNVHNVNAKCGGDGDSCDYTEWYHAWYVKGIGGHFIGLSDLRVQDFYGTLHIRLIYFIWTFEYIDRPSHIDQVKHVKTAMTHLMNFFYLFFYFVSYGILFLLQLAVETGFCIWVVHVCPFRAVKP